MSAGDWKAMFQAIQNDDIELVRYYLSSGVDPNHQHPEFMALPLVESIRSNHLEIARLLLENGADPTLGEFWGGKTPLALARSQKNKPAIALVQSFLSAEK